MRALMFNGGPGRCGDTVEALQRTFTQELTENGWDVDPIRRVLGAVNAVPNWSRATAGFPSWWPAGRRVGP